MQQERVSTRASWLPPVPNTHHRSLHLPSSASSPSTMPPFKIPFRHKASSSYASSRSGRSRRTSASSSSRHSASTSTPVQRARRQRGPFVHDSTSTRAPSEGLMRDDGPNAVQIDETLNEVIMAVDMTPRGTVGCCYYVARAEKLFFMEDIQLGDVDVVDALRMFIDPTVILVSTKIDDTVIDRLDPDVKSGSSASGDNNQFRLPFLLEVRPPSEFHYDTAKGKLINLHLGEEGGTRVTFNVPGELGANNHLSEENGTGQQGQLLRLAGWVDIESRVTVSIRPRRHATSADKFIGWLCWSAHFISSATTCCCIPTWRPGCTSDVPRLDTGDVQFARNYVYEYRYPPLIADPRGRVPSTFPQSWAQHNKLGSKGRLIRVWTVPSSGSNPPGPISASSTLPPSEPEPWCHQ
jgi:hypothetical protein